MNRLLALFVSSLLLASCAGKTNTYELIPYPNELTPRSGSYAVAGAAFTCDERLDEASRAVVEEFAARLEECTGMAVVLWDERRTTVDAHRILFEAGKNAKKRKKTVDAVAASLILEGYLAFQRQKNR